MVFTDSLRCLEARGKSRSSAPPLLRLCRRFAAIRVAGGIRISPRWVPSGGKVADGPSRGCAVGEHPADENPKLAKTVLKYAGQG